LNWQDLEWRGSKVDESPLLWTFIYMSSLWKILLKPENFPIIFILRHSNDQPIGMDILVNFNVSPGISLVSQLLAFTVMLGLLLCSALLANPEK
jgi:hypothetical protein